MISLTCTHCQTVLSIDDAFAGGVCRCQHCGTIQTVPSQSKAGAAVGSATGSAHGSGRTLYQAQRRTEEQGAGSGTGLDDLAEVVASSGLSNSGLTNQAGSRRSSRAPAPAKNPLKGPLLV